MAKKAEKTTTVCIRLKGMWKESHGERNVLVTSNFIIVNHNCGQF